MSLLEKKAALMNRLLSGDLFCAEELSQVLEELKIKKQPEEVKVEILPEAEKEPAKKPSHFKPKN